MPKKSSKSLKPATTDIVTDDKVLRVRIKGVRKQSASEKAESLPVDAMDSHNKSLIYNSNVDDNTNTTQFVDNNDKNPYLGQQDHGFIVAPVAPPALSSWGRVRISSIEEQAARETAAAVLQGFNRKIDARKITDNSVKNHEYHESPEVLDSSMEPDKNMRPSRALKRRISTMHIDNSSKDSDIFKRSPRSKRRLSSTLDVRDNEQTSQQVSTDSLDTTIKSKKKQSQISVRSSTNRLKLPEDNIAQQLRRKLLRKQQAVDWVRNITAQWTDVAAGRAFLLGLRSTSESISIKQGISDNTPAPQKRTPAGIRLRQAGLVLPYSFGEGRTHTSHTVYLKKSNRGVGIKVRDIDSRLVVRGFATWFDSVSHNVRINDVIVAANAVDARSGNTERIKNEFAYKQHSTGAEKISIGLSMIEETICVQLARPNIYVVEEKPPESCDHSHKSAVLLPDTATETSSVVPEIREVDNAQSKSDTTTSVSASIMDIDKKAPKVMPKVRVVLGQGAAAKNKD